MQPSRQSLMGMGGVNANSFPTGISALRLVSLRAAADTAEGSAAGRGGTWAGNADGKGSPIIHTFTKKNESFTLSDGRKMVGDAGECLLLLWRYLLSSHTRGFVWRASPSDNGRPSGRPRCKKGADPRCELE